MGFSGTTVVARRWKTTLPWQKVEVGKVFDIIKLKIANTRDGKKIVAEISDFQVFLPERMNLYI